MKNIKMPKNAIKYLKIFSVFDKFMSDVNNYGNTTAHI